VVKNFLQIEVDTAMINVKKKIMQVIAKKVNEKKIYTTA